MRYFPEHRVRPNHPIRVIRSMLNGAGGARCRFHGSVPAYAATRSRPRYCSGLCCDRTFHLSDRSAGRCREGSSICCSAGSWGPGTDDAFWVTRPFRNRERILAAKSPLDSCPLSTSSRVYAGCSHPSISALVEAWASTRDVPPTGLRSVVRWQRPRCAGGPAASRSNAPPRRTSADAMFHCNSSGM
jgi:hypothetical protein